MPVERKPGRKMTVAAAALALLLVACGCDFLWRAADSIPESLPRGAVLPKIRAELSQKNQPVVQQIEGIKVYFDASRSMEGFIPQKQSHGPGFVYGDVVHRLPSWASASKASPQYYAFGEYVRPISDIEVERAAMAGLTQKPRSWYRRKDLCRISRLGLVLDQAAESSECELILIVTDLFPKRMQGSQGSSCLLSARRLREIMAGDCNENAAPRAIGIIGIKSRFNGIIYDLPGKRQKLDAWLPFYIVAIGRPGHVNNFLEDFPNTIRKYVLPPENPSAESPEQPCLRPEAFRACFVHNALNKTALVRDLKKAGKWHKDSMCVLSATGEFMNGGDPHHKLGDFQQLKIRKNKTGKKAIWAEMPPDIVNTGVAVKEFGPLEVSWWRFLPGRGKGGRGAGRQELSKIAGALSVRRFGASEAKVFSIPDVWAQPELFKAALSDEAHPLFARCRREWRGLLALLGLSSFCGIPVTVREISLDQLRQAPLDTPMGPGGDKNFFEVLLELKTIEKLCPEMKWGRMGIICLNREPVGFLSPTTLVCLSRDNLAAAEHPSAPWLRHGRFYDPCQKDMGLSELDHYVLRLYLRRLLESIIADKDKPDLGLYDPLKKQINSFIDDLGKLIGSGASLESSMLPNGNLMLNGQPLFRHLAYTPQLPQGLKSDLWLKPREDMKEFQEQSGFMGAVLAPETKYAQDWGLGQDEIVVSGCASLGDLSRLDTEHIETLRDSMIELKTALVRSSDFFTGKIYLLEGAEVAAHPQGAGNFLLPVKSWVLLLMSGRELAGRLRIETGAAPGAVDVFLDLEVHSTRTGRARSLTLRRQYKDSDIRTVTPSHLASWPGMAHEGIRHHLLYYSGTLSAGPVFDQPFYPALAGELLDVAGGDLGLMIGQAVQHGLEPGKAGSEAGSLSHWQQADPAHVTGVYHLGGAPEAVIGRDHAAAENQGGRPLEQGILLLSPAREPGPLTSGWRAAVDFGTTNTSVYISRPDRQPEPMPFTQGAQSPLGASDVDWLQDVDLSFIPAEEQPTPFRSLLWARMDSPPPDSRPLVESQVCHATILSHSLDMALNQFGPENGADGRNGPRRGGRLRADLKWGVENQEKLAAERFIGQVILQTLVEVCLLGGDSSEVHWYFAYPLALESRKDLFRQGIINSLNRIAGRAQGSADGGNLRMEAESAAAAYYFAGKAGVSFSENVISLDIGGGTTDVSVWQKQNMLWHNSFRFAGRDVLITYLAHNPDLLEVAKVSLAGMLYHLAQVVSYLNEARGMELSGREWTICLAGNGSRIFKALLDLEENNHWQGETLRRQVQAFFQEAAQASGRVRFQYSKNPKQEVACGLLSLEDVTRLKTSSAGSDLLFGENVKVGSEPMEAGQAILERHFLEEVRIEELTWLTSFLDAYRRHFDANLTLSPEALADIRRSANTHLGNMRIAAQNRTRINSGLVISPDDSTSEQEVILGRAYLDLEPVFIVALRSLVRFLASRRIKI